MSSIKNLKPNANSDFSQGYFTPTHPEKYIGPQPIIYRSSWEKKFCMRCDNDPSILKWSSEAFAITYFDPFTQRNHQYYPDFIVHIKEGNKIQIYVVEIKPSAQFKKPQKPQVVNKKRIEAYKRACSVYVKNLAKFKALKAYCETNGYKTWIVTEKSL